MHAKKPQPNQHESNVLHTQYIIPSAYTGANSGGDNLCQAFAAATPPGSLVLGGFINGLQSPITPSTAVFAMGVTVAQTSPLCDSLVGDLMALHMMDSLTSQQNMPLTSDTMVRLESCNTLQQAAAPASGADASITSAATPAAGAAAPAGVNLADAAAGLNRRLLQLGDQSVVFMAHYIISFSLVVSAEGRSPLTLSSMRRGASRQGPPPRTIHAYTSTYSSCLRNPQTYLPACPHKSHVFPPRRPPPPATRLQWPKSRRLPMASKTWPATQLWESTCEHACQEWLDVSRKAVGG